jgi:hypothetical protein
VDIVSLENVLFCNFSDDVAFTIDNRRIVLSEHQSTVNKNMPLRSLLYIAREYEKLVSTRDRYKRSQIKIPTPQFFVFYNGEEDQPLEQIQKLSDAFKDADGDIDLELTVRVININTEKHHEILEKCRILQEYSLFVDETRKHKNDKNMLEKAVNECIRKDVLRDYLERKSSEVVNMLMAEYDYATDIEVQREEAAAEAAEKATIIAENKTFVETVEAFAENFKITIQEACEKSGRSYEDYLQIKGNQ